ncbi:hypothetical protein BV22DRAFT_457558 [Leucogyrophana mollusca]|uniref:Uncharacterized protein n=1 Tax=Leucogyrophana mollusca TaxID=85980 RepID=A0ACB8BID1_9AGAM|nr:hypothetical protein BV22DRAFT_457558 [Leucogyrophana mollusca]
MNQSSRAYQDVSDKPSSISSGMGEVDRPDLHKRGVSQLHTLSNLSAELQATEEQGREFLRRSLEHTGRASALRRRLVTLSASKDENPRGRDLPILRLPCELLIEIFNHGRVLHTGRCPYELLISHVCRRCRATIITTPSMWTNIYIPATRNPESAALFTLYIDRSQNLPLNVLLEVPDIDTPNLERYLPICTRQARAVVSCAHRLRSLKVIVLQELAHHLLSHFRDMRAPLLRELRIIMTGYIHRQVYSLPYFPLIGGGAPVLSILELDLAAQCFSTYPVSSQYLTSLVLSSSAFPFNRNSMTHHEFQGFVGALPNLSSLGLKGAPIDFPNVTNDVINIPNLLLSTPTLQELRVFLDPDEPEDNDEFLDFLETISGSDFFQVHSLSLSLSLVKKSDVCNIFRAFPNVTHVTLVGDCASTILKSWEMSFAHFSPGDPRGPWPQLQQLEFYEPALDWVTLIFSQSREYGRGLEEVVGNIAPGVYQCGSGIWCTCCSSDPS